MTSMLRPAVFLDRDGTINEEVEYLRTPDELRLITGSAEAIRQLRAAGFAVIVVTNQSGVARGYFSLETLAAIHSQLVAILAPYGAFVDGIYACVHHPDEGCDCRKPQTGLYLQAIREFAVDLPRSVVIGDLDADMLAARNLGIPGILVRTGYGADQIQRIAAWTDFQPAYIAENLLDAASWWLSRARR